MRWSGLCLVASLLVADPAFGERRRNTLKRCTVWDGHCIVELTPETKCTTYWREHYRNECVSGLRRTGAVLASLTTGLFVRGVGSYLVGEKRTAKRLALIGGVGLGGALAGGLPVGISGGYPPTMPLMPVLLIGAGAFVTTWWADVGVAAGAPRFGQARSAPPWSLELATLYLSDPYRQTGLGRLAGSIEIGRLQLGASGLIDAETELRTGELDMRVRIYGAPATGEVVDDGSRLLVRAGFRDHEDDGDRVGIKTAELEVIGRLDLHRIDRALGGSFIQLSSGVGVERISYTGDHDNSSLLLGTFGWGLYLGNRGEAQLFYDHRRESMVGGIAAGRAAGFVGSIGMSLDWVFDPKWAVHLELDVGNAWLTTFAIRYRGGTP